jgi:hypothetical protein
MVSLRPCANSRITPQIKTELTSYTIYYLLMIVSFDVVDYLTVVLLSFYWTLAAFSVFHPIHSRYGSLDGGSARREHTHTAISWVGYERRSRLLKTNSWLCSQSNAASVNTKDVILCCLWGLPRNSADGGRWDRQRNDRMRVEKSLNKPTINEKYITWTETLIKQSSGLWADKVTP